jgi:hypothetical protein
MSTYLVLKKAHSMLASKFSTVYYAVWQSLRRKRQNLKYLNTYSFYSVDEFLMCKDNL